MNFFLIGIVFLFVFFVFLMLYHEIMSFFFPDNYFKSIMVESDNNIRIKLMKKGKTKSFVFNKGLYLLSGSPLYILKRLGCFVHKEGNENPIDLKLIRATGNPELNNIIINQQVDGLWYEKDETMNVIKNVIIGVLGIAILVIIVVAFIKGRNPS